MHRDLQVQSGDVVALNTIFDYHMTNAALDWYRTSLLPLLTARGAKLLLFSDVFFLQTHPHGCYGSNAWRCHRSHASARAAWPSDHRVHGQTFAAEFGNVFYLSLGEFFCTGSASNAVCGAHVPGTDVVAYEDEGHLKLIGNVYLSPYLCSAFRGFGFY